MTAVSEIEWACCYTSSDLRLAGRVLHAVRVIRVMGAMDFAERSVCGRRPRYGFVFDLFNSAKCAHCLRKLGLECPVCRGTGWVPRNGAVGACLGCRAGRDRDSYESVQARVRDAREEDARIKRIREAHGAWGGDV